MLDFHHDYIEHLEIDLIRNDTYKMGLIKQQEPSSTMV